MAAQSEMAQLRVRQAQFMDVRSILAVQEQLWVGKRAISADEQEKLGTTGFLVHKVGELELVSLIGQFGGGTVIVGKHGPDIVGYAVGYPLRQHLERHPGWLETIELQNPKDYRLSWLQRDRHWYFRQIALVPAWQGRGASKQLKLLMRATARKCGCTHSLGEILVEPVRNDASFRSTSQDLQVIGEIRQMYGDVPLVWALVETLL